MKIQGREIKVTDADGKSVAVHPALNSITCDPLTDWLYFAPMGEGKLYRLPLSKFADLSLSDDGMAERIEVVGDIPPSDGITVDAEGNVYIASIAKGEIGVMSKDHPYRTYIKDDRLDWVDGFSYAPDGYIYATVSQLDKHPMFNGGVDGSKKPYLIVRFKPIKPAGIGR